MLPASFFLFTVSFNDLSMTKMARLMRRIRAHPYHVVTILLVFLILIKIKGDVGRHLGVRSYGSNGGGKENSSDNAHPPTLKKRPLIHWSLSLLISASGIPASTGNATLDCFNRFDIEKILSMYTTADYDSESEWIAKGQTQDAIWIWFCSYYEALNNVAK